jgi:hypothetical protein
LLLFSMFMLLLLVLLLMLPYCCWCYWPLLETSKFSLYFSGNCIPINESLFILLTTNSKIIFNITSARDRLASSSYHVIKSSWPIWWL